MEFVFSIEKRIPFFPFPETFAIQHEKSMVYFEIFNVKNITVSGGYSDRFVSSRFKKTFAIQRNGTLISKGVVTKIQRAHLQTFIVSIKSSKSFPSGFSNRKLIGIDAPTYRFFQSVKIIDVPK